MDLQKLKRDKEEVELKRKANEIRKKKRDINNKFRYLKTVDDSMFQYSFLKAQAEEICDVLDTLKFGPFQGFYQKYKEMVTDEVFMHTYYLKQNKYKEISPDNVRLSELLPIKIIVED
jgi:hypothetical protein